MSDELPLSDSRAELRLRLLKSYNGPVLGESTEKARDRLYVVALLTLAYVKLGVVPSELLGFKLGDQAPAQVLSIIFMIFVYSWYAFVARYASDLLGGMLQRERAGTKIKMRDWLGNAIAVSFVVRYFMDVLVPNIVAVFTLFQFGAADPFVIFSL